MVHSPSVSDTQPLSRRIDEAVAARAMLSHPFYQAWSEGQLTKDVLRVYAQQYFHHVEAFPRAVSAVHAACPDREGRRMLAENLAEEEGLGEGRTDHAGLWLDFARGLGAEPASVDAVVRHAETDALIAAFQGLTRRSYAAGLGALYAYESQLPGVSTTKIDGLKRFYDIEDGPTTAFFRVHEAADVEHARVCRGLLDALSPQEQDEALEGATALADALCGFLDGMERVRALH
jgi:pyrroloquinoline-quinone synthase